MSDTLKIEDCPTCGHPCLIASSREGTHHYAPIGWKDEERDLMTALRSAIWLPIGVVPPSAEQFLVEMENL